jgi:hypothetical protein
MELRCQRGEIKRTKAVRDRLDRRCPSQVAVAPQEVINETFYLPSKAAPAARRVVLEYFSRAGRRTASCNLRVAFHVKTS